MNNKRTNKKTRFAFPPSEEEKTFNITLSDFFVVGVPMVRHLQTEEKKDTQWFVDVLEHLSKNRPKQPYSRPVSLTVDFYFERPSHSDGLVIYKDNGDDVDGLLGAVTDALKITNWFAGFRHVARIQGSKLYARDTEKTGVRIVISRLD